MNDDRQRRFFMSKKTKVKMRFDTLQARALRVHTSAVGTFKETDTPREYVLISSRLNGREPFWLDVIP
jgi:hypothetical protein